MARPAHDHRRANAAFVAACLVFAHRRVGDRGPGRADRRVRSHAAHRPRTERGDAFERVLGAGAVVRGEPDQRVVQLAMLAQFRDQPPNAAVHPIDHRGINLHPPNFQAFLAVRQRIPVRLGVFGRRQRSGRLLEQPHLDLAAVARAANGVVSRVVDSFIQRDILGPGVQRPVRSIVGDIEKEWAIVVRIFVQPAQRGIGKRVGHVKFRILRHEIVDEPAIDGPFVSILGDAGRRFLAGPGHASGIEIIAGASQQAVEAIEPALEWIEACMMLARPERSIAGRAENFADIGRLLPLHVGALIIHACQQASARGEAFGSVVRLGEAQAFAGQRVQIRRANLRSVAPQIGIAQIVRQYHQDIRPLPRRAGRASAIRRKGHAGENDPGGERSDNQYAHVHPSSALCAQEMRFTIHPTAS
ncbi:MAG: hypothetical protein BWZ10_02852 [candidate division BRC1 bacterium ADurb.BinA364]|nr:MAG: hypothetical protein BWZ10_02852 [candidate division BRC1 bacterium ADurb.BinA364]